MSQTTLQPNVKASSKKEALKSCNSLYPSDDDNCDESDDESCNSLYPSDDEEYKALYPSHDDNDDKEYKDLYPSDDDND